ncbi:hypothetical protein [Tatumella morbirosei]|uniref:hypothetical protein n=1 Tax=Tatumella morbirosei TaxID=642227 RepID=UPI00069A7821|nr:hypothetical protein [Tatumella morbirosei]
MQLRRFRAGDEAALFRVFCSSIRDIAARDYTPQQIAAWASEDIDAHHRVALMRKLQPFVVMERGSPVLRGVTLENARMRKLLRFRGDSCGGLPT